LSIEELPAASVVAHRQVHLLPQGTVDDDDENILMAKEFLDDADVGTAVEGVSSPGGRKSEENGSFFARRFRICRNGSITRCVYDLFGSGPRVLRAPAGGLQLLPGQRRIAIV
jgi:hypothetical protein